MAAKLLLPQVIAAKYSIFYLLVGIGRQYKTASDLANS